LKIHMFWFISNEIGKSTDLDHNVKGVSLHRLILL
jgi:hypothetical protein